MCIWLLISVSGIFRRLYVGSESNPSIYCNCCEDFDLLIFEVLDLFFKWIISVWPFDKNSVTTRAVWVTPFLTRNHLIAPRFCLQSPGEIMKHFASIFWWWANKISLFTGNAITFCIDNISRESGNVLSTKINSCFCQWIEMFIKLETKINFNFFKLQSQLTDVLW